MLSDHGWPSTSTSVSQSARFVRRARLASAGGNDLVGDPSRREARREDPAGPASAAQPGHEGRAAVGHALRQHAAQVGAGGNDLVAVARRGKGEEERAASDLLPAEQRKSGFAMQSLLIGLGAVLSSA